MEYLPNGDFFQLLENEGRLYESECKYYIAEIATGMNDLHKKGIVHRDIKPQNILISKTGHIKISDFGLSEPGIMKKKKNEQKKKTMTEFEKSEIQNKVVSSNDSLIKIVGSPYFMSP
jgi:serine/threonine-protein kinase RIM15